MNRNLLGKICFYIIEYGTYLALFSPLVVNANFFFPYISPKTIFFRMVVDIIFIAYVILAFLNPRYRPKKNPLLITLIIFIGIVILASLFGVNLARSFWSTFERMTGILTLLHLFVFFLILSSVFQERKYWERIFTVSIVFGVILSLYVFTSKDPTARGGGTIGNTSFMSAYIIFDIFFALILLLTKRGLRKILYGLLLIPIAWLLLFPPQEPTHGAIIPFYGGVFFLFFVYLLFYLFTSGKKLFRNLAIFLIILVILGAIGITQTKFFKSELQSFAQSSSWEARSITWRMGWEAWQEKFWLGWGWENFNIPFAKYYNPTLPISGDIWYDRVHNIVLDIAVQTGILGLASYLAIFGVAIFSLIKICGQVTQKRNAFFLFGTIALLFVYFAQDFFVFDMISSYLMFFLTLAFISFLTTKREAGGVPNFEARNRINHTLTVSLLIIVTLLTIYFGNIQPARASYYIVQGVSSSLGQGIPLLEKAVLVSPIGVVEGSEQISRVATDLVFNENVDQKLLKDLFELGVKALEKNISQGPRDFRTYLLLGRHYNDFYQLTKDPQELVSAEYYLGKAIELSPKNQQGYWSLAQTKISEGKIDEGIELMKKSVDLEPNFYQSRWYLAMTYKLNGNYKSALEEVQKTDEVGVATGHTWKKDSSMLQEVIEIYQQLEDDKKLAELYALGIQLAPKNAQFHLGLAVAYANLGNFKDARIMAGEALQLNPDYKTEIETFLKSLPQ